jgi:hypothetical protein
MTGTATPTILTGTVGKRHHPPILSSYPRNLFTLLGRLYRTKVFQEATDLCPRDLCRHASGESAAARDRALASDLGLVYLHVIAPEGIERDLPSVRDTVAGFGADTGTTTAEGSPGHTGHEDVPHELGAAGARRASRTSSARSIVPRGRRSPTSTRFCRTCRSAPLPALRPRLRPARADRGHPPHDRRVQRRSAFTTGACDISAVARAWPQGSSSALTTSATPSAVRDARRGQPLTT